MPPLLESQVPGYPVPPRQGPRRVRPRRPAGHRRHGSHQRLRLGAADADPRQGPRADGADAVLAGNAGAAESPAQHGPAGHAAGLRRTRGGAGGPDVPGAQGAGGADRVRGARLPGRLRLEGVPRRRARSAASRCRRACARASSCRRRSSRRRRRRSSGHDQNISFEEAAKIIGAEAAAQLRDRSIDLYRRAADYAAARGMILADTKFEWGWTPDGRADPGGRGADAGQLALLAGGRLGGGRQSAVVRQAVRPRLAGDDAAGTRTARRRRCRRRWWRGRGRSTWRRMSG